MVAEKIDAGDFEEEWKEVNRKIRDAAREIAKDKGSGDKGTGKSGGKSK